jgi:pilus assembly protein CpaB
MRQRAVIFILLAVLFGGGTIYLARSWVSGQRTPVVAAKPVEKPAVSVLVAAHDLPTGSFIRAEDLRWQTWPEGQLAETYLVKDKDPSEALTGAVVRYRVVAGEPITSNRVIKPGDRGFLAAVLTPGMRAVAVPVTPVSGVAGLVFPGDHVDVILSHQVHNDTSDGQPQTTAFASETVMTDLRILAIDQSTADIEGKPTLAKTVTFEVTPKQVEAIEVATTLGNLYLSLRGIAGGDAEVEGVAASDNEPSPQGVQSVSHTWDSDVSPLIHHGTGSQLPQVTILRGGKAGAATNVATAAPSGNGNTAAAPAPSGSGK